jgi:general secretion pathway protein M
MTTPHHQILSALAVFVIIAMAFGGTVSAALSLNDARVTIANLDEQSEALKTREKRLPALTARDRVASPSFEARTITQAGAALQQRIEAAIANAKGRLVSSKVDIESRSAERWITLAAELTIAEPDLQDLLFDLETGRPYLFVEAFEAKAPDVKTPSSAVGVSLTVSGQWDGSR